MRKIRLIARLDIKGPNLIKGVHLEGLRVIGLPNKHALRYYQQGADELIYQDLEALRLSASIGNPKITEYEDSVFTGNYCDSYVTKDYLNNLEKRRKDI